MQILAEKGANLEVRDIHGDTAYGMYVQNQDFMKIFFQVSLYNYSTCMVQSIMAQQ